VTMNEKNNAASRLIRADYDKTFGKQRLAIIYARDVVQFIRGATAKT